MLHDLFLVGGGLVLGSILTAVWLGILQRQKYTKNLYDILVAQRGPVLIKELKGAGGISLEDFGHSMIIYEDKGELRYRNMGSPTPPYANFLLKRPEVMLTVLGNERAILRRAQEGLKQREQLRSQRKGEIEGRAAALLDSGS